MHSWKKTKKTGKNVRKYPVKIMWMRGEIFTSTPRYLSQFKRKRTIRKYHERVEEE
jgi:hypothetical protein